MTTTQSGSPGESAGVRGFWPGGYTLRYGQALLPAFFYAEGHSGADLAEVRGGALAAGTRPVSPLSSLGVRNFLSSSQQFGSAAWPGPPLLLGNVSDTNLKQM